MSGLRIRAYYWLMRNNQRNRVASWFDWWLWDRSADDAIPPAYTEFIGHQLLAHLKVAA